MSVKRFVVLPDIHFPWADADALRAALEFTRAYKPHVICQLGDLLDAYELSSHEKDRSIPLQDEIDESIAFLDCLRRQHPKARIAWTRGNHENRAARYIRRNARALKGVSGLSWRDWLHLDAFGIEDYAYNDAFEPFGRFVLRIEHGHKANAAGPGRYYLRTRRCCGISGHTHRLSKTWASDMRDQLWWIEAGHLASLEVGEEYITDVANWQHGIVAGWYSPRDGVHAWGLPIVNHRVLTMETGL